MGCTSCGNRTESGLPKGCKNNGACGTYGCNKLDVFDWLSNTDESNNAPFGAVEVRFKNTRKEYYLNSKNLPLKKGDVVATQAQGGHDVGIISLTGELVRMQLKKHNLLGELQHLKSIYRKAEQKDIDTWIAAQELERDAQKKAAKIVADLGLNMKVSDVEYQGDKTRAIVYYTSETRIDFRELIKNLAATLNVKIEMKQIGTRQEAGLIGAIGSCGRELCCSTWLTDFRSVNTNAARYQQLSINPVKLSGQCGKLKCCLNFELDSYLDALKTIPKSTVKLKTKKGTAFHQKTDVFRQKVWYSYEEEPHKFIELDAAAAQKIIEKNKNNIIPDDLHSYTSIASVKPSAEAKALSMEVGSSNLDLTPKSKPKDKKRFFKNKKKKPSN